MSIDRPRPAARRRVGGEAGFTLIEALVALTVLAAVSPALFRMAVMLRTGTEAVDDHTRSEIVARSLLDAVQGQRDAAQYSLTGSTDGRRWSVEARPFEGLVRSALPGQRARGGPGPTSDRGATSKSGKDPDQAAPKPDEDIVWMPVRVTIRVETAGQPLRIETVALARKAES